MAERLYIERKAEENKYLHRDFHVSGDIGIAYVGKFYGDDGVKEYLVKYAKSFFSKLAEEVRDKGLEPLEEYFKKIFLAEEREDWLLTTLNDNCLTIKIIKCPALDFMKQIGHTPSKWYGETTKTVYPTLAQMCGLKFELSFYNEEDGSAEFKFSF